MSFIKLHNLNINLRSSILLLSVALVVFLFSTIVQAVFTWQSINDEIMNRNRMEVNVKNEKIDHLMQGVEKVVSNAATAFEQELDNPKRIEELLLTLVRQNTDLLGSAIAFVPNYYPDKTKLYSPYVYREGELIRKSLLEYDYTKYEWYALPMKSKQSGWCEPYTDGDGTYVAMRTYSVPLRDSTSRVVAVLTGDLPMTELSYATNSIYHRVSMRSVLILGIQLLGILLIIFIFIRSILNVRKYEQTAKENQLVSEELNLASQLQTNLLPQYAPSNSHLNLAATLIPAHQMCGDFYDYSLKGDCLYFCIGDVAIRGLSSALAMTVTRTVYRSCLLDEVEPAKMMYKMNHILTGINENYMYATFFAGKLNLSTGVLCYCNAGHCAPYLLSGKQATSVDVASNVPLGIIEWNFVEQQLQLKSGDVLFFFTDGIVEAMNNKKESFGEKRLSLQMRRASENRQNPSVIISNVEKAVNQFLGIGNKADDDLTMMAIGYM